MSGFKNDVVFAKNADFSQVNNSSPSESNGLATDGQLWTGSTAVNAGGTHVNVGQMTSPNNSITFGYSSPNITAEVNTSVISDLHITPYIVSAAGLTNGASYTSIQPALDAANAMGGGMVYVQPGTYTENLIFYPGITLIGASEQDVFIVGTHTPPTSGTLNIFRCAFSGTSAIFSSAAAGTCAIIMEDSAVTVTNGWTFDLLNWVSPGSVAVDDIGPFGTNDGFFRNTGGAGFFVFAAGVGNGTANPLIVSGLTVIFGADFLCPMELRTGAILAFDDGFAAGPITFLNNSTGAINNCRLTGSASPAITMSSSADVSITNSIIDSTNNPAIDGAGAGTLTLGDVTFLNNSAFASTLNLASKPTFARTPIYTDRGSSLTVRLNSGSFVTATSTLTTPPTTGLSDGDRLEFVVTNGTLTIQLAATQVAHIGTLSTSVAGTMTSTNTGDALVLKYQASTNDWWATSVIGTWLIA